MRHVDTHINAYLVMKKYLNVGTFLTQNQPIRKIVTEHSSDINSEADAMIVMRSSDNENEHFSTDPPPPPL